MSAIKKQAELEANLEAAKTAFTDAHKKLAELSEYIETREKKIEGIMAERSVLEKKRDQLLEGQALGKVSDTETQAVRDQLITMNHKVGFLREEIEAAQKAAAKLTEDLGGILYNRRNLARSELLSHIAETTGRMASEQCGDLLSKAFSAWAQRNGYIGDINQGLRHFLFDTLKETVLKNYKASAIAVKKTYGIDW